RCQGKSARRRRAWSTPSGRKCAAPACPAMSNARWRGSATGCRRWRARRYLRRHCLELFVVNLVLDRLEGRKRFGRKRDRLAAAVGRGRRRACGWLARERVERGADAAAELN